MQQHTHYYSSIIWKWHLSAHTFFKHCIYSVFYLSDTKNPTYYIFTHAYLLYILYIFSHLTGFGVLNPPGSLQDGVAKQDLSHGNTSVLVLFILETYMPENVLHMAEEAENKIKKKVESKEHHRRLHLEEKVNFTLYITAELSG